MGVLSHHVYHRFHLHSREEDCTRVWLIGNLLRVCLPQSHSCWAADQGSQPCHTASLQPQVSHLPLLPHGIVLSQESGDIKFGDTIDTVSRSCSQFFMITSFQFFNTNPLEEDLKQACLFWNVISTVLSLVGRFQVAYGSQTASPPLEQTWADALCKLNRMLHGAEFYFSWELLPYNANKEEEKDVMPFFSLNQFRNISIWLDFKYLFQWNVKEIDQNCSLQEENCQCIKQFPVTVSRHPFISAEIGPVTNPTWQPYQRGCHISVDVPDFLAFL